MDISKIREDIEEGIKSLKTRLYLLQESCPHTEAVKTANSKNYSGDWNKSQGSYWYEFKCPSCDKSWTKLQ